MYKHIFVPATGTDGVVFATAAQAARMAGAHLALLHAKAGVTAGFTRRVLSDAELAVLMAH
jgi:hypothetical protein